GDATGTIDYAVVAIRLRSISNRWVIARARCKYHQQAEAKKDDEPSTKSPARAFEGQELPPICFEHLDQRHERRRIGRVSDRCAKQRSQKSCCGHVRTWRLVLTLSVSYQKRA